MAAGAAIVAAVPGAAMADEEVQADNRGSKPRRRASAAATRISGRCGGRVGWGQTPRRSRTGSEVPSGGPRQIGRWRSP